MNLHDFLLYSPLSYLCKSRFWIHAIIQNWQNIDEWRLAKKNPELRQAFKIILLLTQKSESQVVLLINV